MEVNLNQQMAQTLFPAKLRGGKKRRKKRVRDSLENIALEFVFNVICTGKNVAAR